MFVREQNVERRAQSNNIPHVVSDSESLNSQHVRLLSELSCMENIDTQDEKFAHTIM